MTVMPGDLGPGSARLREPSGMTAEKHEPIICDCLAWGDEAWRGAGVVDPSPSFLPWQLRDGTLAVAPCQAHPAAGKKKPRRAGASFSRRYVAF
jgi:hypothetical protein